jgi:Nucleotidyl transferase AbiEii toxin, Type IV TA system
MAPGSKRWPASHWRELLASAAALVEDSVLPRHVAWSWGGGTRLAQLYDHRLSYDIDIFITDVQALLWLSPRLNDAAARLTDDYVESSESVKLSTAQGDIDFIAAPVLTSPGTLTMEIDGRVITAQTAEEVLAKKLQFRGHSLAARDAFDLAVMLRVDRSAVDAALIACSQRALAQATARLRLMLPSLTDQLEDSVRPQPQFERFVTEAPCILERWLGEAAAPDRTDA